jgi:hypothetical protein
MLSCVTAPLWATPSGLNNIPTADTIGEREVAVQVYDNFGHAKPHSLSSGFKTGIDLSPIRLELGVDSQIAPKVTGPSYPSPGYFQTKAAVQPWDGAKLAIGIANLAIYKQSYASDPFSYTALTQDLNLFRATVGFGFQTHNDSVLLGVDRTWKLGGRDLNLNADLVQTNNQSRWMASTGIKYSICKPIVVEAWASFPEGKQTDVTLKINYIIQF